MRSAAALSLCGLLGLVARTALAAPDTGASAASVMQTIRARVPALSRCAPAEGKKSKTVRELVVSFTVNESGAVAELQIRSSSFEGKELGVCVKKQIAAWSFPPLDAGPADFELPLQFTPNGVGLGERVDRPARSEPELAPPPPPVARAREGGLDTQTIYELVQQHAKEVEACYTARLERSPKLAGKVRLGWRVLPSGQVASVEVLASTLHDPPTETCLCEKVQRWIFPSARTLTNVDFPFVFTP